ncbi:MAG: hypothetical protein ACREIF_16115 [Chthoniobacterales bacterium]
MRRILPFFIAVLMNVNLLPAQEVSTSPTSVVVYEELPELKASEILRPEFLQGPHFKVQEEVPTYSGANRFTIESDFGVFEADGNEMLVRRVNEIQAIARLKDVSRTEQYKDALVKAAKAPLATAKNIVTDPINTIGNAPKGIMKFMKKTGESMKNIGKKGDESDRYEGSKMAQMIGYSNTKRKVALSLHVDPYSSNTVLQRELDGIAWATFAGGATFSLATMPIGGGVGIALTTVGVEEQLENVLRDNSPGDLKKLNHKALIAMGATEKEASRLLGNGAFSPTAQTAFVLNLKSLGGVENRRALVRLSGETSHDESDAIFYVQTAELMGKLHKGDHPLERIALLGDFPICIAKDGTVIAALQWDYAAHTKLAADFAKALDSQYKDKPRLIAISGVASPQLKEALEANGDRLQDRLNPGPLR